MSDAAAAPAPSPALPKIPLLSSLGADDLRYVIERVDVRDCEPATSSCARAKRAARSSSSSRGRVQVVTENPTRELASLGEGAFFGELALLTDFPRSATVVAAEPTQLLEISRELVSEIVQPLARGLEDAPALLSRPPARSPARLVRALLVVLARRGARARRSLPLPRARAGHAHHRRGRARARHVPPAVRRCARPARRRRGGAPAARRRLRRDVAPAAPAGIGDDRDASPSAGRSSCRATASRK